MRASAAAVQLPLGIRLRDGATLENYVAGPNTEAVCCLDSVLRGMDVRLVYLWGAAGTGKTHLLEAVCRACAAPRGSGYLPLRSAEALSAELLIAMEELALICIDDVDAAAGCRDWEERLFHLYNRAETTGARLVVTASKPPAEAGIRMPDLVSRLSAGMIFHLAALDDDARCRALTLRAEQRGFRLPVEVVKYLLRRQPRDMHSLFALLDRLDEASLADQRRVTIPFVKQVLDG